MTSTSESPHIALISEARFTVDGAGQFYSTDPALSGDGWRREVPEELTPVLLARASFAPHPDGEPVHGLTKRLPYYVGPGNAVLRMPAVRREIMRALDGCSLALIKVPGMLGLVAALSARRKRIPLAAEVVGDAVGVLRSGALGTAGRLGVPFVRALTRWTVGRAVAVRYVTRRQLQSLYPPARGATVSAFSDVTISDSPEWRPRDLAIPRLVSMGSMDQLYKGHHLLIEALATIRAEYPAATLTVIGSGRHLPELQRIARRAGVEEAVRFAGYLDQRTDIEAVFADASLFVLPSLTEGMPRVLIEAMAFGLPAVGSRVGGVTELLPQSATFEPGDVATMTRLIREVHRFPERLESLSAEGIAATRGFRAEERDSALGFWQRSLVSAAEGGRA